MKSAYVYAVITRDSRGGFTLSLEDTKSGVEFVTIDLDSEMFSEIITGKITKCHASLRGLNRVGKKMVLHEVTALIPEEIYATNIQGIQRWVEEELKPQYDSENPNRELQTYFRGHRGIEKTNDNRYIVHLTAREFLDEEAN